MIFRTQTRVILKRPRIIITLWPIMVIFDKYFLFNRLKNIIQIHGLYVNRLLANDSSKRSKIERYSDGNSYSLTLFDFESKFKCSEVSSCDEKTWLFCKSVFYVSD